MKAEEHQMVEHLFRTEYGKLLAVLTRFFGPAQIHAAEDIVQDTLISALDHWSTGNMPSNPTGWLIQVAKRKALNEVKRNQMIQKHHERQSMVSFQEAGDIFLESEIEDNQLRMIFTCCQSTLNVESQIALTLKTLCGFGAKEVANALLSTETTINKRLYRAKEKIRNSDQPFTIPQGKELDRKLEAVGLTLYLLFNEGYNSTGSNLIIQKELCLEAMRLTRLLVDRFVHQYKLNALLSLMCFHVARFDARIDDHGAIILFEDQDRRLWNKDLIHVGMQYLKKSIQGQELSAYHIEARIAAEHCLSESFDKTNWQAIYEQYLLLGKLKPNPVIQLNLAIIKGKLEGADESLLLLGELAKKGELRHYHLLPATQGAFHMELKNYDEAIVFFKKALTLNPSGAECRLIKNKIEKCEELLPKR